LPYQLETPKKNRIIGAVQAFESEGIKWTLNQIGDIFDATQKQVRNAIKSEEERIKKRSQLKAKNHKKISERDLDHCVYFIDNNDWEGHDLNWKELLDQFGFDCHWTTLKNRLIKRGYNTFIAAHFEWVTPKLAKLRISWCETMIKRYPTKGHWHHVRFSDEVHFGWGPEGVKRIIRKRGKGNRYKPECIQRIEGKDGTKEERNAKRIHFWGAIGYNFKSPLIEYTISTNNNGKMSQIGYRDQILKPEVAKWCKESIKWCLEEDGDSGHGGKSVKNLVIDWKKDNQMSQEQGALHSWYFNCPQLPDLAIVEECWSHLKQYVKKRPHWDDQLVREMVQEAWAKIPQRWINKLIESMPQLLEDCIASGGQKVARRR
jgi:hypothetical protein